jgi:RNA polymerase sigma-70 factor (ECF subfamily)
MDAGSFTHILSELRAGKRNDLGEYLPLVYGELRRLAAQHLRRERTGHTLQPTALVNEVYLRLQGKEPVEWQNRAHFFGFAARLMRQVLVDYARAHGAAKRGGPRTPVPLDDVLAISPESMEEVLMLNSALERLAEIDEQASKVVELRFLMGLSAEETAEAMGISKRHVVRHWAFAKPWLMRELERGQ